MAKNRFSLSPTPVMGATGSFPVTPADSAFAGNDIIRAITIGVSGTVRWLDADGVVQDTGTLPIGTYPLNAKGVYSSGTTASSITAWY